MKMNLKNSASLFARNSILVGKTHFFCFQVVWTLFGPLRSSLRLGWALTDLKWCIRPRWYGTYWSWVGSNHAKPAKWLWWFGRQTHQYYSVFAQSTAHFGTCPRREDVNPQGQSLRWVYWGQYPSCGRIFVYRWGGWRIDWCWSSRPWLLCLVWLKGYQAP